MSAGNKSQTNSKLVRPDGRRQAIRTTFYASPSPWSVGLIVVGLLGFTPPSLAFEQIDLANLDGSNGFALNGINVGDSSGSSVSGAGDVNGDGFEDLIIGAHSNTAFGDGLSQSYVVFGSQQVISGGVIELSELDGRNGFTLEGFTAEDGSGFSVSGAGDVNGDGFADLVIGAPWADQSGNDTGQSYVVFGNANVGSYGVIELSKLDGHNGFVVNGFNPGGGSGWSVSGAGDVNGDGFADIIIGAPGASPNGVIHAGQSYVIFGGYQVGSSGVFELVNLNGDNGFAINGINTSDESGLSVSGAGDVNGDGFADLIIGAPYASPNGYRTGQSYVVFGGQQVGSDGVIELSGLDGSNGFALDGINVEDGSGHAVSEAGDVNGDGFADFLIGAEYADPNGIAGAGQSYLVFGGQQVGRGGVFELTNLDGHNGFVLNGINAHDRSGNSVSDAGDINGDGYADLAIGASDASPNGILYTGQSYVVFGGSDLGSSGAFELSGLDGSNGFALNGINPFDHSGWSVSGTGDFNGDGVDDLIIGAPFAAPNGDQSGQSYVVFGQHSPLPLSDRSALANCLVEAGFAASAAIITTREDCDDSAGQWKVEVLVPGAEREPPLNRGSFTLFKHNRPVVRLTGRLPVQKDENILTCSVSSQGANNVLADEPFAYAGRGAFVIDQSTLDTEAMITIPKRRHEKKHHGKGRMVLRAAGEKHFTAVYEDGQFAGIEDAGTLTIFRRQQGVDETLSNWNETSLQSAPEGYFADATAEVNGEQCTIRIEASIEEAASYKLIAGTWTITKPKNDERDD